MKKEIFFEIKDKITGYVRERRLRDAFSMARSLSETNMAFEATRELERAEENYRLMLDYASRGAEDPSRDEMAGELGETILASVDRLQRVVMKADEPTLYYNVLRFEETRPHETISKIAADYLQVAADSSLLDFVVKGGADSKDRTSSLSRRETIERRLFNRVWVTFPLRGDDTETLRSIMASDKYPSHLRRLVTGAMTLGGLDFHDPSRTELLMEAYAYASRPDATDADSHCGVEALTGMLLLMYRWRERPMSRRMKNRLATIRELPNWKTDLKDAFMELVRTRDTERITRKMRDEVLPDMMKLGSDLSKKINPDGNINIDPADLEENPEWAELMENSGLGDRLREMNEIQEQGGDIMMGTFSNFKTFPFFNDVANWFIPFHGERSEFTNDKAMVRLAEILEHMPMLCDSDKYSMVLSVSRIPADQHRMILDQLQSQTDHLKEIAAASLSLPQGQRKNMINKHVQNLYRFYGLFRRKGEFSTPFESGLNLSAVDALAPDLCEYDTLMVIGEFYFSHKYYKEALEIFNTVARTSQPDVQLLQKTGYCLQQLGDLRGALELYSKADMMSAEPSQWTLRRIGRCHQMLGEFEQALDAYRKLEALLPMNASVALSIGHCLVELKRYEEAVQAYFKAEYLDEKSGKALRPLAWSLLMLKDFGQSRKYYERILTALDPTPDDYLNMGHLSLAEGRFAEALNFYKLNISSQGSAGKDNSATRSRKERIDKFITDMKADSRALASIGIPSGLVPLIIDSILYTID